MKTVRALDPRNSDGPLRKTLYYDPKARALQPDICIVDLDGNILWQSNTLRLRGPDVDDGKSICVTWGDSVAFGTFHRSWPEILNDFTAHYTFLNGGVEGFDYVDVLSRAIDFNARHEVALNIIMPGWYKIGQNSAFAADLEGALRQVPRAVLVTMPTSLNSDIVNDDIRDLLRASDDYDEKFEFWGSEEYSIGLQGELFAHITHRNALIGAVAKKTEVPVADIYAALDSRNQTDFRNEFFDVSHPRPRSYQKMASAVWKTISPLLTLSADTEPRRTLH